MKPVANYLKNRLNFDDLSSSLPLLRLITDREAITQIQAADELGLSVGACNLHFQRLEHEGLISRTEIRAGQRGRPALRWSIREEGNATAAVVFSGSTLSLFLFRIDGLTLWTSETPLNQKMDQAELLRILNTNLNALIHECQDRTLTLRQTYLALPGILDPNTGNILHSEHLPMLDEFDVVSYAQSIINTPLYAGSTCLAYYHGEIADSPDKVSMIILWDLGVGMVCGRGPSLFRLGDQPRTGLRYVSEIGQIHITHQSEDGHRHQGTLESFTGGEPLMHSLGASASSANFPDFLHRAESPNSNEGKACREAAGILGKQASWPIQLMGAERIILTGDMAPTASQYKQAFMDGLASTLPAKALTTLDIAFSSNPAQALETGCFELTRHLFLNPETYGIGITKPVPIEI